MISTMKEVIKLIIYFIEVYIDLQIKALYIFQAFLIYYSLRLNVHNNTAVKFIIECVT